MLSLALNASAYSNDYYSLDVHPSFSQDIEGSFTDSHGRNINIQITPVSSSYSGKLYTEENLDLIVKEMLAGFESVKEDLIAESTQQWKKRGYTEKEINEIFNNYKIDEFITKEITTFTKNEYQCFHLIYQCSYWDYKIYQEIYQVHSKDSIITLTTSVDSLSDLNSDTIQNMINSFTINYYQPYAEESFWVGLMSKVIVAAGVGGLYGTIAVFVSRRKNKAKYKDIHITDENNIPNTILNLDPMIQESYKTEDTSAYVGKAVENIDQKLHTLTSHKQKVVVKKVIKIEQAETSTKQPQIQYCYKCGTKLIEGSIFCSKCGSKIAN